MTAAARNPKGLPARAAAEVARAATPAADELQLVQAGDWRPLIVRDRQRPPQCERRRIDEANDRSPVADHQEVPVVRQPPCFTDVRDHAKSP